MPFFFAKYHTVFNDSFRRSLVRVLQQLAEKLSGSTSTLHETSAKVATTSDFLSESSSNQNATIQGTSQAVQEISSMTEINRNDADFAEVIGVIKAIDEKTKVIFFKPNSFHSTLQLKQQGPMKFQLYLIRVFKKLTRS